MSLTPLSFFAAVEARLRDTLPQPSGGGEWRFQRLLSFHDGSGSLQVLAPLATAEPQLIGVMQVRQMNDEKGAFLRGSTQTAATGQPLPFVLHSISGDVLAPEAEQIVLRWAEGLVSALEAERLALTAPPAKKKAVGKKKPPSLPPPPEAGPAAS